MILLRTLFAALLSMAVAQLIMGLWATIPFWFLWLHDAGPVSRDLMVIMVSLAGYYLAPAALLLSLAPVFLACWAASYSRWRRLGAAAAGVGLELLAVLMWQNVLSLWDGNSMVARYAIPDPITRADWLGLGLVLLLGLWATLRNLPVRGRVRDWLRRAPRPAAECV